MFAKAANGLGRVFGWFWMHRGTVIVTLTWLAEAALALLDATKELIAETAIRLYQKARDMHEAHQNERRKKHLAWGEHRTRGPGNYRR